MSNPGGFSDPTRQGGPGAGYPGQAPGAMGFVSPAQGGATAPQQQQAGVGGFLPGQQQMHPTKEMKKAMKKQKKEKKNKKDKKDKKKDKKAKHHVHHAAPGGEKRHGSGSSSSSSSSSSSGSSDSD